MTRTPSRTPSRRRTIGALAASVAAALLLAACSGTAKAETTASSTPGVLTTVRAAVTTGTTTLDLASAQGFFEKHGIKLESTSLATGTETIAAVQGGSADIAYADTFAGANAITNGFDVKVVAGANYTSPAISYLVKADSDIKTVADLKGKSLGLGGVPFFRVFANEFLKANKVDASSVSFTVVKQATTLPEALANGSVDAIQSLGYQVAYSNEDGQGYGFRTIGDTDTSAYQNPKATQAAFWSTSAWGEKNAKTAQAFADAYREFAAWYNGLDVDKRTEIALEYNKVDYAKIAGGDEKKLANLANLTAAKLIDAPFDAKATQEWLETGHEFAPQQVPTGVKISSALLPSAK